MPALGAAEARRSALFADMNSKLRLLLFLISPLLAFSGSSVTSFAQGSVSPEKETLSGRVLAQVDRPYGSGVGPLWQLFIFGLESENEPTKIKPVLVAYLFHNFKLDPPLRDGFFDHSKLYELRVARERECDEGVKTLSIVKNETVTGEPLPPSPGIWFIDGAPKGILEPEMVLPCYAFHRGDYRVK